MENSSNLKLTPIIEKHKELGARLAPFGGWLMPIQYSGIIEEHNWVRSFAGVFDTCHMGILEVEADLDNSNIEELVTVNLKNLSLNSCGYGFILNEDAGVIDDLIVYKLSLNKWLFVVNAATTEGDLNYLQGKFKGSVSIKNISGNLGKVDLQGPLSRDVLQGLLKKDIGLKYFHFDYFNLLGEEIIISRTGYTGELGFEFYMPKTKIPLLWDEILKDKRVKPAGLGARDTLRLEMGYSLYGQDIDSKTTPLEAGLKLFIDWDKEFIGKEALLKDKESGLKRRLVSFEANSRRAPRHNYRINYKDKDIGFVTSGSFSPSLGVGIGLGYITEKLAVGEDITLTDNAVKIEAKIVKRPFYKKGSVKN